ncbi:E3 ubiquitin ligase [Myotisia sp. PD_48]|nr:E3 ubiquitin ligase [Myotisia sp. PD_48]
MANGHKRKRSHDVDATGVLTDPIPLVAPVAKVTTTIATAPALDTACAGLLTELKAHVDDIRALIYCGICMKPLYEPFTISCGHTFCYSCLLQWFTSNPHIKTCPGCRAQIRDIPAPAYLVRDIVHMIVARSELADTNENVAEHEANKLAELEKVERDRNNEDPETGGLFQGCFRKRARPRPIRDPYDDVDRCPHCIWELEEGECLQCGYVESDISGLSVSVPDDDESTDSDIGSDAVIDLETLLYGTPAHRAVANVIDYHAGPMSFISSDREIGDTSDNFYASDASDAFDAFDASDDFAASDDFDASDTSDASDTPNDSDVSDASDASDASGSTIHRGSASQEIANSQETAEQLVTDSEDEGPVGPGSRRRGRGRSNRGQAYSQPPIENVDLTVNIDLVVPEHAQSSGHAENPIELDNTPEHRNRRRVRHFSSSSE